MASARETVERLQALAADDLRWQPPQRREGPGVPAEPTLPLEPVDGAEGSAEDSETPADP